MPSTYEGLPMVLLEAMSCGTPVVGSQIPAIAGVVRDGETGILFPVGAPDRLASAVTDAFADRERLERRRAPVDPRRLRPGGRRPPSGRLPRRSSRRTLRGPHEREQPLMVAVIKRATRAVALGSTAVGGLSGAHMMLLLGAALLGREKGVPHASDELTLAVVVPAHDEEHQIAATIRGLQTTAYPPARRRIVVIADNCSDATAQIARATGVDVLERQDPARRGKGHALAWAFPRILEDARIDAVCIVDADCEVSANLLRALSGRLHAGADAVQARYVVSDPAASSARRAAVGRLCALQRRPAARA